MKSHGKRKGILALLLIALLLAGVIGGAVWISGDTESGRSSETDPASDDENEAGFEDGMDSAAGEFEDELAEDLVNDSAARIAAFDVEPVEPAPPTPAPNNLPTTGGLLASGRLLDAATSEPLPLYAFALHDGGGGRIRLATDERGAFAATEALRPGLLRAVFSEAGRAVADAAELRADDEGKVAAITLRIESGPTYRFVTSPLPASPIEEFTARLVLNTPSGPPRVRGTLGGGTAAWVRFAPIRDTNGEGRIILDSADGVWRGLCTVNLGQGIQRGVVTVSMQAFASIRVTVVDGADRPVPDAIVTWDTGESGKPRVQGTRKTGQVGFERIASETGTLTVRKLRYVDDERALTPQIGELTEALVRMVPAPSAGAIEGTVFSDSGTYARDVSVRLLPLGEGASGVKQLTTKLAWTGSDGARVGRFRFDDLPVGRWRVAIAEEDWYDWEPRRFDDVESPTGGLEFRVHDTVPVVDLVFDPVGVDGQPVSGFTVRLLVGSESFATNGGGGPLVVSACPVDKPLRWRIDSRGLKAAFGDWSSLAPLASQSEHDQRGARPMLERGAAQMFRVVRSDNRRPIAGVVAIVEGREVGQTDGQGRIVVEADEEKSRVTFRYKEWRQMDVMNFSMNVRDSKTFERTVRLEVPKNQRKKR